MNIAYQTVGSGPIDLAFVPGWTSNVELMWEEPRYARYLERLASFSRLILFDKRGQVYPTGPTPRFRYSSSGWTTSAACWTPSARAAQ